MKYVMVAMTLAAASVTGSAFAQSVAAPSATMPDAQTMAQATPNATTGPTAGQWVSPYGQPVAGKTRAQVYQELVHAEKDGQLAYLNSTLYAHH